MTSRTTPDDTVVDINTTAVDLDLDQVTERPSIPAFRVRLGGRDWEITEPDAGLVMELDNARNTDTYMQLIFDDQWPDVRPLLAGKQPDVLIQIIRQYSRHFDLDAEAMVQRAAPSRAERRQARRPQRRH